MDRPESSRSESASPRRRTARLVAVAAAIVGVAPSAYALVNGSSQPATGNDSVAVVSAPATAPALRSSAAVVQAQQAAAAVCSLPGPVAVVRQAENTMGLTLNQRVFKPRGLQVRAFVTSLAYAQARGGNEGQLVIDAQNAYGQNELSHAKNDFNANEVRFQVSQWALNHPEIDPNYLPSLKNAINLARCKGLVVILSMQNQDRSGPDDRTSLPSAETKSAWDPLTKAYGNDLGVMLEIYNETGGQPDTDTWRKWAHAGTPGSPFANATETVQRRNWRNDQPTTVDTVKVFGMQPMINYLRNGPNPAKNVLILSGLKYGWTFENFAGALGSDNPFVDPLPGAPRQIIYSVHPYLRSTPRDSSDNQLAAQFDAQFGNFSTAPGHYVLATEWSARETPDIGSGLGSPPSWRLAVTVLNYLIGKKIYMSAGAYDAEGIMIEKLTPAFTPSNYNGYCAARGTRSNNNAGLLVKKMFEGNYTNTVMLADGVNDGTSTAPCS